ncbi:MAG: hypothetical protein KDB86_05395 [Actinobacteria bacterium]|nr:hypothetical protein [Actinomycetota bacterium]MCB9390080.1 hypothetical protein [Acidimicrobiia bacterium]
MTKFLSLFAVLALILVGCSSDDDDSNADSSDDSATTVAADDDTADAADSDAADDDTADDADPIEDCESFVNEVADGMLGMIDFYDNTTAEEMAAMPEGELEAQMNDYIDEERLDEADGRLNCDNDEMEAALCERLSGATAESDLAKAALADAQAGC